MLKFQTQNKFWILGHHKPEEKFEGASVANELVQN